MEGKFKEKLSGKAIPVREYTNELCRPCWEQDVVTELEMFTVDGVGYERCPTHGEHRYSPGHTPCDNARRRLEELGAEVQRSRLPVNPKLRRKRKLRPMNVGDAAA